MNPKPETRNPELKPARMNPTDLLRVGLHGIKARPTRTLLSALGIAIGISAMITVVGISTSGKAQLQYQLNKIGTNLLTVTPGNDLFGEQAYLPTESTSMITRIAPVTEVAAISNLTGNYVYRNNLIPKAQSGGITTYAADLKLLKTLNATIKSGKWLTTATNQYPTVVLGSDAATTLGINQTNTNTNIQIGGQPFTVIGILNRITLASNLDNSVLIGTPIATTTFGFKGNPSTIYVRAPEPKIHAVAKILAATTNPAEPNKVNISRPSDALEAKAAIESTLTTLLLSIAAIALIVGGIGIANTMIISVLERRNEIGLRRSLGATRHQIRTQFLTESLLLSLIGGTTGTITGILTTTLITTTQNWPTLIPTWATLSGLTTTTLIGITAGLHPANKAAKLPPTQALTTQ